MKPCSKCGTNDRYPGGKCKVCYTEHSRRWSKNNPEKRAELLREWRKRNPEKHKANVQRRLRRQREQVGPDCRHDQVKAIYLAMEWLRAQGIDVHVDHIVPLAAGGLHAVGNLAIVPASYNLHKSDKVLP